MKNQSINKVLRKLFLIAILAGSALSTKAQITTQMSGTYTINTGIPCSATNFKNMYSFVRSMQGLTRTDTTVASLQYNNTTGIGGAITLDVKSNFNDVTQSNIPALFSSTNTLTINGNGFIGTYSSTDAYLLFNGADYCTVKNLYIKNTTTSTTICGIRFH